MAANFINQNNSCLDIGVGSLAMEAPNGQNEGAFWPSDGWSEKFWSEILLKILGHPNRFVSFTNTSHQAAGGILMVKSR